VAQITWTDWYGDGSLVVVDVALACCALEYEAAADGRAGGTDLATAPAGADYAVVVSGTVTDRLAPAVLGVVDAVRQRDPGCRVVAYGACAAAGGPYWDSYAVTKGIGQLVPVDAYVAGCPPPPDALEAALRPLSSSSRALSTSLAKEQP
jgi:NADH-quinone oxidoreductase subunit B